MFFAKVVFPHNVLRPQMCSFNLCVYSLLSFSCHLSFVIKFRHPRWLQVFIPTSNLLGCVPYQILQLSKNLFNLLATIFW
jgi:hypothetical protein